VVGNIPFGNYPVFDPAYRRTPQLTRGIHDYFLAKSLDVVRPGGLIALITSRYTMDKQDSTVREHLANGAMLLGAIRLPNTAFKANAGTDVTTDILFLQKRSANVSQESKRWTELASIDTPDGKLQINEYFVRHPEMMLGRMGLESAQYCSVGRPRKVVERSVVGRSVCSNHGYCGRANALARVCCHRPARRSGNCLLGADSLSWLGRGASFARIVQNIRSSDVGPGSCAAWIASCARD
jgi:hypothetical protein